MTFRFRSQILWLTYWSWLSFLTLLCQMCTGVCINIWKTQKQINVLWNMTLIRVFNCKLDWISIRPAEIFKLLTVQYLLNLKHVRIPDIFFSVDVLCSTSMLFIPTKLKSPIVEYLCKGNNLNVRKWQNWQKGSNKQKLKVVKIVKKAAEMGEKGQKLLKNLENDQIVAKLFRALTFLSKNPLLLILFNILIFWDTSCVFLFFETRIIKIF